MASFIKIHEQVTELWEKSYYFWITPRTLPMWQVFAIKMSCPFVLSTCFFFFFFLQKIIKSVTSSPKSNEYENLPVVHRKMSVLYVWLVSSKYMNRLQSYGKSPITFGSPLVHYQCGKYLL